MLNSMTSLLMVPYLLLILVTIRIWSNSCVLVLGIDITNSTGTS